MKQRKHLMTERTMKGRLRFFDHSKGFGYIVPDEPGDHVFVHYLEDPGRRPA